MDIKDTVTVEVPIAYWGVKSPSGKTYTRSYADSLIEHFDRSILQVNFSTESDLKYVVGICKSAEIRGNLVYGTIEFLDNTPAEVLDNVEKLSFTLVPRIFKESVDKDEIGGEDVDFFSFIYVFMPGAGSRIQMPATRSIIL